MPNRRFSFRSLVREVRENLSAAPARLSLVATLTLIAGTATALSTIAEVSQINRTWKNQIYAGRFVDVVRVADNRGMPAYLCDSLQSISGVIAAGGLIASQRIYTPHSPTKAIELHHATPGYLAVAWPQLPVLRAARVVVGSEVGNEIGLVDNTTIRLAAAEGRAQLQATEPLTVDWVAPQRSRIDGINRAVVVSSSAATAHTRECLVEYEPGAAANASQVVQGWFPTDLAAVVTDLLRPNHLITDPERQLTARTTGFNWVIAGGFLSVFLCTLWWSARAETGLYRLLGMTRIKRAFMYGVEVTTLVAVPFQIGFSISVIASGFAPAPVAGALVRDNLATLALLSLCPLLGILVTGRTPAIETVKDH